MISSRSRTRPGPPRPSRTACAAPTRSRDRRTFRPARHGPSRGPRNPTSRHGIVQAAVTDVASRRSSCIRQRGQLVARESGERRVAGFQHDQVRQPRGHVAAVRVARNHGRPLLAARLHERLRVRTAADRQRLPAMLGGRRRGRARPAVWRRSVPPAAIRTPPPDRSDHAGRMRRPCSSSCRWEGSRCCRRRRRRRRMRLRAGCRATDRRSGAAPAPADGAPSRGGCPICRSGSRSGLAIRTDHHRGRRGRQDVEWRSVPAIPRDHDPRYVLYPNGLNNNGTW